MRTRPQSSGSGSDRGLPPSAGSDSVFTTPVLQDVVTAADKRRPGSSQGTALWPAHPHLCLRLASLVVV